MRRLQVAVELGLGDTDRTLMGDTSDTAIENAVSVDNLWLQRRLIHVEKLLVLRRLKHSGPCIFHLCSFVLIKLVLKSLNRLIDRSFLPIDPCDCRSPYWIEATHQVLHLNRLLLIIGLL